ncbi:MAG: hypothetical protein HWE26_02155 [Alteromonadaceae bacterium]|nr:hypothetical protein [Alteromonadaceae bacterium]
MNLLRILVLMVLVAVFPAAGAVLPVETDRSDVSASNHDSAVKTSAIEGVVSELASDWPLDSDDDTDRNGFHLYGFDSSVVLVSPGPHQRVVEHTSTSFNIRAPPYLS